MAWYKPERHVCLEPYLPYCEVLGRAGFELIYGSIPERLQMLLRFGQRYEAVYLLDVLEHLDKHEGGIALALAQQVATVQVVVYTPDGYVEQTTDVWGYGGDHWQTHRSGWTRSDFAGWRIEERPVARALFAIWDIP